MAKANKSPTATTDAPPPTLEVQHLPIESLQPNPWNVNRMDDAMQHKLCEYIRREGLVEPIVVRRMPDHYQIIGGYHRWSICKDRLKYTTIPCVVLDVDENRAKVLSINLNQMSGQPVPVLLASLLHDLNKATALTDLETMLPFSKSQMEDSLELLKLPDGLEAYLEEQAAKEAAEAPVIVTIVLDRRQADLWEQACEIASVEAGQSRNRKARTLELMANAYIATAKPELAVSDHDAEPERPAQTTERAGVAGQDDAVQGLDASDSDSDLAN